MSMVTVLLLGLYVCGLSIGQLLFKKAANQLVTLDSADKVYQLLLTPSFLFAVLCYAVTTFVWVAVLTRLPLTVAYAFTFLSVVMTTIGACFVFEERLHTTAIFGFLLIFIGVYLVIWR